MQLQQGLFVAFREHAEECQIIIRSEALRDCIQGTRDAYLWYSMYVLYIKQ